MKNALSRDDADICTNIEAGDGVVRTHDVVTKTAKKVVCGGQFVVCQVEISRRVTVRKDERMERRHRRCVADGERQGIAHDDVHALS